MESKILKDEEYFRAKFLKLGSRSFIGALRVARQAGLCHKWYQHYMALPNLEKMINKDDGGMLWLSRLDNTELNDGNEGNKYGSRAGCKRMYVGCFSYGGCESAAMWKMYCKPNAEAVRILISHEGMRQWDRELRSSQLDAKWIVDGVPSEKCKSIACAGIGDVLYASVKKRDLDSERYNALSWNGVRKQTDDLYEWSRSANVEGFLKDCEWDYEKETRLFVKVKRTNEDAKRLAIRIPKEVFNHMSIVLGPWMAADVACKAKQRLQDLFVANGYNKPHIRQSYLTGALDAWR